MNSGSSMEDNTLSHLFEETVQISSEQLTWKLDLGEIDPQEPPGRVLLGKLISKEKLGRNAITGSLKKAWASFIGWSWKEGADGMIHFYFASQEDAWNVLRRRPWLVCEALLIIMTWPSWLNPSEIAFDNSPFWIRIKGIPLFFWNRTNIEKIALKASPNIKFPRNFDFERGSAFGTGTLRFMAHIDINKPLFSGFFMKREKLKDLWLQFEYEKLPKICYKCGVISHEQKFCFKKPTVIKDGNGAFFPLFGNWMKWEDDARWPFDPKLPKWFEEWIIQQKLTVDEKFKAQWKMEKLKKK